MDDRARLEARIEALYGGGIDWARATGVIHVAAIDGVSRAAIAVGPGAPASSMDRFVLGFARARADAIVTTGAILRAESTLVHRFADEPRAETGWRRFRAEALGRAGPPMLVVLTAGGDWPPAHPALREASRAIVLTTEAGRARLVGAGAARAGIRLLRDSGVVGRPNGVERPIEVVALDPGPKASLVDPLARAIDWLRRERGCETVVLESGPRSTLGLYSAPESPIDELLLSVFEGPGAPIVDAPRFPDPATLAAHFALGWSRDSGGDADAGRRADLGGAEVGRSDAGAAQPASRQRFEGPSGAWVFERYRRPERVGRAIGSDPIRVDARATRFVGSSARATDRPE
ncbi:MAG: hypothetical protein R3F35_05235 [Myxococcota bacterium]